MLTTLIYRSHLNTGKDFPNIPRIVNHASKKNKELQITGILLFNGLEFFQVLEGDEDVVNSLFIKIRSDSRHTDVVELMQDYSSYRRFSSVGFHLFYFRSQDSDLVKEEIFNLGQFTDYPILNDRMFNLISAFIERGGRYTLDPKFRTSQWRLECRRALQSLPAPECPEAPTCQFALQPIIEPMTGSIASYEALIRSPTGGSAAELFSSVTAEERYLLDLKTKASAFSLAKRIELNQNERLNINFLPGTLYTIPYAVDFLLDSIMKHHLNPEQIIIEVTENEIIAEFENFYEIIKKIRVAGIGLAIDDFGAGYSGLSLLTKFQPDKIKIDITLIRDIHLLGSKQAIVASMVQCCADLGITVVAEGVEKLEEWFWLETIGVHLFQGFLFSRPCLNGIGDIRWPVRT